MQHAAVHFVSFHKALLSDCMLSPGATFHYNTFTVQQLNRFHAFGNVQSNAVQKRMVKEGHKRHTWGVSHFCWE